MKKSAVVIINLIIVIGVFCLSTSLVLKQHAVKQSMGLYSVVRNHRYEKELAQARRDDVLLDIKSYVRTASPDELNAAPLYIELKKYKLDDDEVKIEMVKNKAKSDGALFRKFVGSHSQLYKLVHKTMDRPYFYVSRDFANPINIRFLEISETRRCTRLLRIESISMVTMNNGVLAVRNMAKGFQPGNHVTQEPFLIALLVSYACDAITFRGIQDILTRTHGEYRIALAVQDSVKAFYKPHYISGFLKYEMASQCVTLEYLKKHDIDEYYRVVGIRKRDPLYNYYKNNWEAIIDLNGINLLNIMRSDISVVDLPYPQAYPKITAVDNILLSQKGIQYAIAKNFYPSISSIVKKRAQDLATANVTLTAADVFIYKAKYGAFPDRLEQACAKPLQDPFDLKPIKYKREGKGFVVYSVGETGKYDGHMLKKGEHEQMYRYTNR